MFSVTGLSVHFFWHRIDTNNINNNIFIKVLQQLDPHCYTNFSCSHHTNQNYKRKQLLDYKQVMHDATSTNNGTTTVSGNNPELPAHSHKPIFCLSDNKVNPKLICLVFLLQSMTGLWQRSGARWSYCLHLQISAATVGLFPVCLPYARL